MPTHPWLTSPDKETYSSKTAAPATTNEARIGATPGVAVPRSAERHPGAPHHLVSA
jgi:hypothetical protein